MPRPPPPLRLPILRPTPRRVQGPTPFSAIQGCSGTDRRPLRGSADGAPGSAGVPPAWTVVGPRRVVHCGPSGRARATPALPGTLHAKSGSSAEMTAAPGVQSSCLAPRTVPAAAFSSASRQRRRRTRALPVGSDDRRPRKRPQSPLGRHRCSVNAVPWFCRSDWKASSDIRPTSNAMCHVGLRCANPAGLRPGRAGRPRSQENRANVSSLHRRGALARSRK